MSVPSYSDSDDCSMVEPKARVSYIYNPPEKN